MVPPDTGSTVYQQIEAMEKRVQAARLGLQVVDMPLDQVTRVITQRTGIPMRIDERALEDVGLSTDTPVTFNLPEVAAETLLYLMLKELDLVYMMDTGSVLITSPEEEESSLRAKFYAVEDIFNDPNPNYDILIEMITCCVEPESWEELGGPASIVHLRNGVIITQTYQNHRLIQGLFAALRRVQKSPRQDDLPAMISISPHSAQSERLAKRLQEVKTSITLTDAELGNAVTAISNFGRIPILIDNRALEDVGLSPDVPVTLQLGDVSIDYMLDVMLERLDLTTMIIGEVVIVTTPEEAESELPSMLYPVKDLVRYNAFTQRENTKRGVTLEFDDLIQAITTAVEAESWEELGGPGSLASFPYADCLVVTQLRDVHRQVAELLEQVRKAKPKVTFTQPATVVVQSMPAPSRPPASVPETHEDESIIVMAYAPEKSREGDFSREDFVRIAQQLKQTIAPQSWSDQELFADATHSGLFVRHNRSVQRLISSYLANQGLVAPPIEEEDPPTVLERQTSKENITPPAINARQGGDSF
ncbi:MULTISPECIES: hypothetical protein [Pirellulaceae]|uniref:hypothetical protein n=1 Tax=Pirellulaceae TaxID=2691357 RepID=UPI0011B03586|nr:MULTISPECIES: hypothetical protein [Pirellulaceae]